MMGLVIVGLALALAASGVRDDEELGHSDAWSFLQAADSRDRGHGGTDPVLETVHDSRFAGLGIGGRGIPVGAPYDGPMPTRGWLILNEHAADGKIRIVPEFPSYVLPCEAVVRVRAKVRDVDRYVLEHLSRICVRT